MQAAPLTQHNAVPAYSAIHASAYS